MLNYFPQYFANRAIICYLVTLAVVSFVFMGHILPFQFMLFGLGAVLIFFLASNRQTKAWRSMSPKGFSSRLFSTALVIRLVYTVFIYFYFTAMTGQPHGYGAADELFYEEMGGLWRNYGYDVFSQQISDTELSDSGYPAWLAFEKLLFGTGVLIPHLIKCFFDAGTCVLIYKLGSRNFGDSTGRMAAIFCMLMPNFWYYCGVSLKETEMVFLTVLFAERTDYLLRSPRFRLKKLVLPVLCPLALFTFRTVLATVLVLALGVTLVFSSNRMSRAWKNMLYVVFFAGLVLVIVRMGIAEQIQEVWEASADNQSQGMEWRSQRVGGNAFAKYAGAAVFAPLIFTIPFPTMVEIPWQEPQMMFNGANFIKNIMSGFTILALFMLFFRGEWRKHVLPLAIMLGYLVVIAFSNFAQSERFHLPALPFELMFAAYGISQLKPKHKTWFSIWIVGIAVANVAWAWFKLAGRGMV